MLTRLIALLAAALTLSSLSLAALAGPLYTTDTKSFFGIAPDTLEIHAFNDPDIAGVVCYVTQPKRALSFEDPTDTSIACRKYGKIAHNPSQPPASRSDLFSASKGLFFKQMRVDRVYDAQRNVLLYLAYTRKVSGHNAAHSLSAVPLAD